MFPYSYDGYYNVGDRCNKLFHVMEDHPECIINFDATHNTVIRIREQDTINQYYYPRQMWILLSTISIISRNNIFKI
jgi:hypothetical protein